MSAPNVSHFDRLLSRIQQARTVDQTDVPPGAAPGTLGSSAMSFLSGYVAALDEAQLISPHESVAARNIILGREVIATSAMEVATTSGKKPFFGIALNYQDDRAASVAWLLHNRGEPTSGRRIHAVLLMAGDELGSTSAPVVVAYGYSSAGIEVFESCYVHHSVLHDLRNSDIRTITITEPGSSFDVPLVYVGGGDSLEREK